jgi:hypothetical protein
MIMATFGKVKPVAEGLAAEIEVINTIPMIRPEDRVAEPVIAQVAPTDVDHWKSHGWAVKE